MSVTLERHEKHCLIRLASESPGQSDRQIGLASAEELKALLLEWLASGKNLEVDLDCASEIDITVMQLLWAAAREAARTGARIDCRASSAVTTAVRDSGFDRIPGFPLQD